MISGDTAAEQHRRDNNEAGQSASRELDEYDSGTGGDAPQQRQQQEGHRAGSGLTHRYWLLFDEPATRTIAAPI